MCIKLLTRLMQARCIKHYRIAYQRRENVAFTEPEMSHNSLNLNPVDYAIWGQWRIQNFIMGGGRSRRQRRWGLCPLYRIKIEFLPETGGFWCILGLLFTFKKAYETN